MNRSRLPVKGCYRQGSDRRQIGDLNDTFLALTDGGGSIILVGVVAMLIARPVSC